MNPDQFKQLAGGPAVQGRRRQGERLDASSPSTPTARAPARRSRTAGRRPRRSSTRRSATRSGTPSTSRRSWTASWAASATSARPIVPPVLSDWHVEPDDPRTFDIELAKSEAGRGGLQARRERRPARQGRQADQAAPLRAGLRGLVREVRGVRQGLVRPARDRRLDPGPHSAALSALILPPEADGTAEVRHRAVGLGGQPGSQRSCSQIFRCDADRRARRTASTATRSTTSCTTSSSRRPAPSDTRRWPRCRT